MSTDPKSTLPDLFPLPEPVKLRTPKFGARPVSNFVPVPTPVDQGAGPSRPAFRIDWQDQEQGLTVRIRETADGHLSAEVFSTDAALLNQAAVSVGLLGTAEGRLIRKTVPLNVAEPQGCSGSADLGPLADAVQQLGPQLAAV